MKRGRKRKNVSPEEEEGIRIPSSALLPARLLPVKQTSRKEVDSLPIIKKEVSLRPIKTEAETSENANESVTEKNVEVIRNITSKYREFLEVSQQVLETTNNINIEANNKISFNLQNVKSEPVSPDGCTANPTFDDSNYYVQNVGNLDLTNIKCEPRSRSSSTETVLADESLQLPVAECQSNTSTKSSSVYKVTSVTHSSPGARENSPVTLSKETVHLSFSVPMPSPNISVTKHKNSAMQVSTRNTYSNEDDTEKNVEVIRNLTTSKYREFPEVSQQVPETTNDINIEANNKISFNLQNVNSEPVSPVSCTANPTFEDSNYCVQNVGNLDLTNIKCEPRSRSSSTETVLADESQQLPVAEFQSNTSTQSSSVYKVTSVAHSSPGAGESSPVTLSKETVHLSFSAPMPSPNISVTKQKNSDMQVLIRNIYFVTKLFKYSNFDIEIARSDAKDCLNYLDSTYISKRSFSLFFGHDPFHRQRKNPASETLKPSPIESSTPNPTEISTDVLKKIIEMSSCLPSSNSSNFPLPHQNNSENNIMKDTKNINALSVSSSISPLPTPCSKMNKKSGDCFAPNIRIKDEPLDDCDASSVISLPTFSQRVSTSNKKSSDETTTEMRTLMKKNISPDHSVLETGHSIDTQIKPTVSHRVSTSDKRSENLALPLQNNSENNIMKDTKNVNALSVSGSISPLPTLCSKMNKKSGDCFAPNIRIKDEPLDDYDASSVVSSPTVSHRVSTSDKRSANLALPLRNNSENNIMKDTKNINALSVSGGISPLPTLCSPMNKKSGDSFTPNIRIKDEPLDDYDESSVISSPTVSQRVSTSCKRSAEAATTEIHGRTKKIKVSSDHSVLETGYTVDTQMKPTVSHRVSTSDKRSAEETTEMHALAKKIKISPDNSVLKTGYSIDAQIKPGDGNEKYDSIYTTKGSIHNQSLETGLILTNALKSWPLSPHNSCINKNIVSDTENTSMSSSNSIPCVEQSGEEKNLTITFNELFNPKVRETKPLGDCKTSNISTAFQQSLTACGRSTGKADNDIHEVTKMNTVAELKHHSVASITDDGVATLKVTNNMLQNDANMSHVFFSDSKSSKAIESIAFKSVTSKPTAYSHLVPQDIHKNVSCTDKAPNTSLRTILSPEPSTSVTSNFTVVTTVSDSNINSNNTNYNHKTPVINKFLTGSTMQHTETTNLGDDRNPSDVSNPLACNRINTLNYSQPGIISSKNARTKKKISASTYLKRKSSLHLHDQCTQKNIAQNSVSQISSPDSSVQPVIASLEKMKNNRTPIAYSKNSPHYNKSTSASRSKIASNVQHKSYQNYVSSESISMVTATETPQTSVTSSRNQNQVIAENSSVSHNPPRRSAESLATTSRDPRKSYSKRYSQKVSGSSKQDFSSILRRDAAGNKFIETKDLPNLILNWNVSWLSIQKEQSMYPPIWDNCLQVKDTYHCIQDYYDTYQPLHLLNIWFNIYDAWEKSNVFCNDALLYETKKEEEFVKMSCTVILNATDRSNWLKKEDILICTSSSAGNTEKLFGRIVDLIEHDYYPSPSCPYFQKPGVWKKLYLEITCAQSFAVQLPARVLLQNLININIALKQNDALNCKNPAMQSIVLNPKQNERLFQTVCVPPLENVSSVENSVRSLQHRVTIVNTLTPSDSVTTTLLCALHFKKDSMILVGVKDEETFLQLALNMKTFNTVLAIREDEVSQLPPELQRLTVKYCDSETLKSCQVVLTLIPSMFFGEIEGRLTTESLICVIHEAQCFFETETALLLAYKVEHLILTGRPGVRASTTPMLGRFLFDVSLFHRISGKK